MGGVYTDPEGGKVPEARCGRITGKDSENRGGGGREGEA